MCPDVDDLVITLIVGNETHVVIVHYLVDLFVTFIHQFLFFLGNDNIVEVEGQSAPESHLESQILY